MNRKVLLATLKRFRQDLVSKSTFLPGTILVSAIKKTLSGKGRFNYFVNCLPDKYQAHRNKLTVIWRNTIIYLKARASLFFGVLFRFVTAGDDRVRPNHAALDGLVLHKSHPMLNPQKSRNIIPPLEANCRCLLLPLSPQQTLQLLQEHSVQYYMTRKLPTKAFGYAYKGF